MPAEDSETHFLTMDTDSPVDVPGTPGPSKPRPCQNERCPILLAEQAKTNYSKQSTGSRKMSHFRLIGHHSRKMSRVSDLDESKELNSGDFDDLLPYVGEYGRYQQLLIWLVCLPACIPCGFHAFNQLFMADDYSTRTYSQCKMYNLNYDNLLERIEESGDNLTGLPNLHWPITTCKHGWAFNKTEIVSSVVIDFELVCDKSIYPTLALCVLNVGGIIGVYLFGTIADKLGRRIAFFLCLGTELLAGMVTALCPNFTSWLVCRFFVGLTIPAIYQIPFIIAIELVGPTYRAFITVMTCLYYTVGLLLLSGVAYTFRNWKTLCYVTTVPFFVYGGYWWVLPESPRWLLAKGKLEEACRVLKILARMNGKVLPKKFYIDLRETGKHLSTPGFCDLFKTPNMRKKTLLITMNWFANATVYVGLSYYGPAMGDNEYMSFFLSCVVEVPSYLLCWFLMEQWGRRWPMCIAMILGGACSLATVLMPTVRGVGIGLSSYLGGIGLCIIPFINYLGHHMLVMPLLIMGALSILGGIGGLWLPETYRAKLPQTVAEGEEFGKDMQFWECPCHKSDDESSEASSTIGGGIPLDTVLAENVEEGVLPSGVPQEKTATLGDTGSTPSPTLQKKITFEKDPPRNSPTSSVKRSDSSRKRKTGSFHERLVKRQPTVEIPINPDGSFAMTHWY
ncbi:unnamed protein product [Cyprideis torosa]|uniref:Uncharacterized protein n=1 Tax=Cyprideis torosa TaxID=163714 RepID=A0A7R8ZIA9_9CRUS|nr:unnamed protein product [Cyprideis torosa]CAG0879578.1 unnamed protein product [Cyprideis torosa]